MPSIPGTDADAKKSEEERPTTTSSSSSATRKPSGDATNTKRSKSVSWDKNSPRKYDGVPKASQSTRIKSVNPLVEGSLFVFLAVLALLFTVNFDRFYSDYNAKKKKTSLSMTQKLNNAAETLSEAIKRNVRASRGARTEPCSVFLSDSSIPGAGRGLFAGQDFEVGVVVARPSLLISYSDTESPTHETVPILFSNLAYVVKHHPTLVNVQGRFQANSLEDDLLHLSLTAIRPIRAGEELFVDYQQHPAYHLKESTLLGKSIPVLKDYEQADKIRKVAQESDRVIQSANNNIKAQSYRKIKVDSVYVAMKRSVELTDPSSRIAHLLPVKKADAILHQKATSSMYASLNNKTLDGLQLWGACMDDLVVSSKKPQSGIVVTTRAVAQGSIVAKIPLYAIRNPMTCASTDCGDAAASSSGFNGCISGGADASILLCPLLPFPPSIAGSDNESTTANVDVQWESQKSVSSISSMDFISAPVGSIMLKLNALEDLQPGTELRLHPQAIQDLFFDHWSESE